MRNVVICLLCLSFAVTARASAEDWCQVFEFRYGNPRAGLFDGRTTSPGWTYAYIPRAYPQCTVRRRIRSG